jgi:hypothetical protein
VHLISSENVLKPKTADANVDAYLQEYYGIMGNEVFYVSTDGWL